MRRPKDEKGKCYYGRSACGAIAQRRPRAIRRAFLEQGSPLVQTLIRGRIAFREAGAGELERLARTRHHEGVVLFADPPRFPLPTEVMKRTAADIALIEPGINPHNLGAIMRSAAHFGIGGIAVIDGPVAAYGAVARTAEGAAERIPVWSVDDGAGTCASARTLGYRVAGLVAGADVSLFDAAGAAEPTLWLFGHEGRGLGPELEKVADARLSIPGTGAVESLNLSVAAAVVFAERYRCRVSRRTSS